MTGAHHLSHQLLDDFFVGARGVGELAAVAVGHLAEVCPGCRPGLEGAQYADAFARAEATGRAVVDRLRREHHALPDLLAELLPLAPTEIEVRVATDGRFATVAFVDHELAITWAALDQGASGVVQQAAELATVALRRLERRRYGALLIGRLDAELSLAWARLYTGKGRLGMARAYLLAAGRLLRRAGRPPDLRAAEALAAAELRLASGRPRAARRLLAGAADDLRRRGPSPWRLPVERLAARIDRLGGAPAPAARRLRHLLDGMVPAGALQWSVARELVFALAEAGELGEAMGWLVSWGSAPGALETAGAAEKTPEGRPRAARRVCAEDEPDVQLLLGGFLRRQGKFDEARRLLRGARDALLRRGRGADALLATVELLRLHQAAGDPAGLRLDTSELDRLAECRSMPRAALRELTRFAAAAWRGKVEADLGPVERSLLYAHAPSA